MPVNRPFILYEGHYNHADLEQFKSAHRIWETVDIFERQLRELFEILYPAKRLLPASYQDELQAFLGSRLADGLGGNWIYYPWNGYLVHAVNSADYLALRTNRNKNLITREEQEKLINACIGIVGLSIGSHFVESLAYNGIANALKLAEFDTLETSNLNRLRAGIKDVGEPKIALAVRRVYEIHPYADLFPYPSGLTEDVLHDFLYGDPQPQLIFEVIDDFKMKVRLRIEARKARIPVIMLTNLGDNILVDVERYDLDPSLPLFNGLIGYTPEKILQSEITEIENVEFVIKFVGREYIPTRALQTLYEINRTLVGRPQLYSTVTVGGGLASYLARRFLLGKPLPSGRQYLSFDQVLHYQQDEAGDDGAQEGSVAKRAGPQ
jgi:hypothetical protein